MLSESSLRTGAVISMSTRSLGRFAVIIVSAAAVAVGVSYLLAYHAWLFPIATAGTGFVAIASSFNKHVSLRSKGEKGGESSKRQENPMLTGGQRGATTNRGRQRMGLATRWLAAVAVSVAGFSLSWWGSLTLLHLDGAVSLGVAGAVLAMLIAVAVWWAPITADGDKTEQRDITAIALAIVASVVLMLVAFSSAPWWWRYMPWDQSSAPPPSAIAGMSGGCAPFEVIAQHRYPPYGAAIHAQPNPLSTKVGGYVGNAVISVNGWVYGTAEYPTNLPPWNSNIWFHLTDGAGWVAYPDVRAYPTTPDPDGLNANGGPPVTTSKSCEGEIR